MADGINMERRGIPAAVIALDKLANTTARAMARAHGAPDYPFAVIPTSFSAMECAVEEQVSVMANEVTGRVEAILLGKFSELKPASSA